MKKKSLCSVFFLVSCLVTLSPASFTGHYRQALLTAPLPWADVRRGSGTAAVWRPAPQVTFLWLPCAQQSLVCGARGASGHPLLHCFSPECLDGPSLLDVRVQSAPRKTFSFSSISHVLGVPFLPQTCLFPSLSSGTVFVPLILASAQGHWLSRCWTCVLLLPSPGSYLSFSVSNHFYTLPLPVLEVSAACPSCHRVNALTGPLWPHWLPNQTHSLTTRNRLFLSACLWPALCIFVFLVLLPFLVFNKNYFSWLLNKVACYLQFRFTSYYIPFTKGKFSLFLPM